MIDRRSKWPEAIPAIDITADTVAKAIYNNWITRFGCPIRITSDQGRQFESNLFNELLKMLGIERIRTTPYHPQSNGMIERWHRSLKAALTAKLYSKSWVEELPTVMLGLRSALRDDTQCSAAELTYGCTIRLPGEFYTPQESGFDDAQLVQQIRRTLRDLKPIAKSSRSSQNIFVHPDLEHCSHIFIRNDTVKRPLTPTYNGPYKVLERTTKIFKAQLENRVINISIDRIKPAYLLNNDDSNKNLVSTSYNTNEQTLVSDTCLDKAVTVTRSGRVIKPPVRFDL